MIRAFTHSQAGGHAENEDAFIVRQHASDPECWLCAVADGQGGRAGGAAAATLACRTCLAVASTHAPAKLIRESTWVGILREADQTVARDPEAGLTTLLALCVRGERLCGASSGDSAAVLLSAGGNPLTLTSRQPKSPPVGSGAAGVVSFAERLPSPWRLLAMSDGVWKYAGWDAVVAAAGGESGQRCVDALQEAAALPRSGQLQDDFTLVVLEG
jgi:serine/threonine protein phosphatase PrpC